MGRKDGVDRLYGPTERHLSALHDNFDPSCFHTPVSNIGQQRSVKNSVNKLAFG